LIAVVCTAIGFFIDASRGSQLTHLFAAFYIIGCVLAALMVRYRGLFTAMVLPPLLLVIAVPLAYEVLVGRRSTSMKDIVLNLGIPLVNRFPTMAVGTLVVLAIGAVRVALQRMGSATAPKRRPSRSRPRRSAGAGARGADERSRRRRAENAAAPAETLRRRARSGAPAAEPEPSAPRPTRRTPGRVAERPPRVSPNPSNSRSADRAPAPEPEPVRRRNRAQYPDDVPPHPRPNVRYRGEAGRIDR
jgi:hypothetical protein